MKLNHQRPTLQIQAASPGVVARSHADETIPFIASLLGFHTPHLLMSQQDVVGTSMGGARIRLPRREQGFQKDLEMIELCLTTALSGPWMPSRDSHLESS